MASRESLHEILVKLLGTKHVYYRPPASLKLIYPCIVYDLDKIDVKFANNRPYSKKNRYSVIYIDHNPTSKVIDKISDLSMCAFDRSYVSNNLNHFKFTLYH